MIAIILLYAVAKIYVLNTPNPHDDAIPDIIKNQVLNTFDF